MSFTILNRHMSRKAIVIGASSGIGRELAKILGREGYEVGLVARRLELLHELQKEMPTKTWVEPSDVTDLDRARQSLQFLLQKMGSVDLIVVNAGFFSNNQDFVWEKERQTIEVNVLGFAAMAHTAMAYFLQEGKGHLVGISSVSGIRGERNTPSYSASKAFVSTFLEALQAKVYAEKRAISITDIQPGWVDTAMAVDQDVFWMAPRDVAAQQMYTAIERKKAHAYVTGRWRLIAWVLKLLPRWIYVRLF